MADSSVGFDRWFIPEKLHGHIIGRGGENINKLRSLGVTVELGMDKSDPHAVLIQGGSEERSAAKKVLELLLGFPVGNKPLGCLVISVPGRIKGRIIGPKGSVLNQLVSKFGCSIEIAKDTERVELVGPVEELQALKLAIDDKFDRGNHAEVLESELPDGAAANMQDSRHILRPLLECGAATVLHGTIAKWDESKGYGFIQPEKGGQQLFCHQRALVQMSSTTGDAVREEDRVVYTEEYDTGRDTVCAGRVQVVGGFLESGRFPLPIPLSGSEISEVLFFEDAEDPQKFVRFLDYLRSARSFIDMCVFSLTHDDIARTLVTLHKCGIVVRVIVDNGQSEQQGSQVEKLREFGVEVRVDNIDGHMHHKFTVLDRTCLLNGSFNYTRAAAEENEENIIITNNQGLVRSFNAQFEKLWVRCKPSEFLPSFEVGTSSSSEDSCEKNGSESSSSSSS